MIATRCRFRTGDSIDECGLPKGHPLPHAEWSLGPSGGPNNDDKDAYILDLEMSFAEVIIQRNKAEKAWAEAHFVNTKLIDALKWCSGSPSFGPEGEAREGWLRICQPLLGD